MRLIAGILLSALIGVGLAAGATAAIVTTNAPDKAVEDSFNGKATDLKQRDVVPYGQR